MQEILFFGLSMLVLSVLGYIAVRRSNSSDSEYYKDHIYLSLSVMLPLIVVIVLIVMALT